MTGAWVLAAALVVAAALAVGMRLRDGRLRSARPSAAAPPSLLSELGIAASDQGVTLVQFSTAFCQPCVATRRILDQVTAMVDGVRHVEVDAESHLDLVRRLGILRTPTVLVLDRDGHETKRASGTPRKADVIAAIGPLLVPAVDTPTTPQVG